MHDAALTITYAPHTRIDLNKDGHISLSEFTDAVAEAKAIATMLPIEPKKQKGRYLLEQRFW